MVAAAVVNSRNINSKYCSLSISIGLIAEATTTVVISATTATTTEALK